MVHFATLFTLSLAAAALAHRNLNKRSCIQPPQTISSGPSSSPVAPVPSGPSPSPTVLVSSEPSSPPVISYVTITKTLTIQSCPTPGSQNPGNPTSTNSLVELTSVNPLTPPTPSTSPTSSYPNGDYTPSGLPISSSDGNPPAITPPSSTNVNLPNPSSPAPIPSSYSFSSVASSPASSVSQPAYTGGYDRNAICGNQGQKRQLGPIQDTADFSKRNTRRRIVY